MAIVGLFMAVAFNSCDDDENNKDNDGNGMTGNTLSDKVENGSSLNGKIDLVKAEDDGDYVMASVPFKDGGFTLELPESPGAQYLEGVAEFLGRSMQNITVSAPAAKLYYVFFTAYKSNESVGSFSYGTADWEGDIMYYADRDVSITGTSTRNSTSGSGFTYIDRYNLHLKKGWNMIYSKYTEGENTSENEETTTVPAGAKWYFTFYDSPDEPASSQYGKASALSLKRNH
jgi:hypothetical protein